MLTRVIDFETTGLSPETDGICEVGWTDVHVEEGARTVLLTTSQLCDPGCVISHEAMAVHHIRNEDVAGLQPSSFWLGFMEPCDVLVAHNAEFEQSFWPGRPEGVPWICTYKVALRTHPESLRHTNQYLRYDLGLGADPVRAAPSHRAGPDTYVTALLLLELMKYASLEDMIRWSAGPALLPRIPFGKFRGKAWADVDLSYLKWIVISSDLDKTIKINAKHWIDKREGKK
jgi:exodeoxyribonuclease X